MLSTVHATIDGVTETFEHDHVPGGFIPLPTNVRTYDDWVAKSVRVQVHPVGDTVGCPYCLIASTPRHPRDF